MNKTSDVLIYRISLARTDKYSPKNTNNNLPCTNAKNKFSVGLYFCSLILRKDFSVISINYIFNENGKPSLESGEYGFSISYTNDYVYIAVVRNNMIGLDAEQINDIDLDVSKEFMSERELVKLKELTNKHEYFYTIWTLKEAYIKLVGKGIDDAIVDTEFIEDENGRFFMTKEIERKIYYSNVVSRDCIISVATYNFMNYKIIDFANTKEFLKKYDY